MIATTLVTIAAQVMAQINMQSAAGLHSSQYTDPYSAVEIEMGSAADYYSAADLSGYSTDYYSAGYGAGTNR